MYGMMSSQVPHQIPVWTDNCRDALRGYEGSAKGVQIRKGHYGPQFFLPESLKPAVSDIPQASQLGVLTCQSFVPQEVDSEMAFRVQDT